MHKPLYYYLYTRSPILKIAWGILSVIVMMLIIAWVGVTEEGRMTAQTANWNARSVENGAALYTNNCASCHGNDGKGLPNVAPALHSRYFFSDNVEIDGELVAAGRMNDVGWTGSRKNYVMLTVAAGRPSKAGAHWSGLMATWGNEYGGPLRGDQVEAVANYVVNWEESALEQTAAEDPWQFFHDTLSKQLPYAPSEEGYELKLEQALAAAEASGATRYTLDGQEYEFEQATSDEARSPQELWLAMGCAGCHNIAENQTEDNIGQPGPHQNNLYERAGERVEGQTAEEYIYNSIVNPNDYIVEGYVAGVMPQNFSELMTEDEINSIVAWMLDPDREQ